MGKFANKPINKEEKQAMAAVAVTMSNFNIARQSA